MSFDKCIQSWTHYSKEIEESVTPQIPLCSDGASPSPPQAALICVPSLSVALPFPENHSKGVGLQHLVSASFHIKCVGDASLWPPVTVRVGSFWPWRLFHCVGGPQAAQLVKGIWFVSFGVILDKATFTIPVQDAVRMCLHFSHEGNYWVVV